MAIRAHDLTDLNGAVEFARALLHIKGNSGLTMTAISKKVDPERSGLVSWLLSPLKPHPVDNAPKELQAKYAWKIAVAVAGEGQLVDDPVVIFHFLVGIEDNPLSVLVPHLRLVGNGGEADNDATAEDRRKLSLPPDGSLVPAPGLAA